MADSDYKQIRSMIREDGKLVLSIEQVEMPEPGENDVLIRVEASPINPSDLGLLFGGADMTTAVQKGTAAEPIIEADIAPAVMQAMAARIGHSMPVGNEGAGVVVAAGSGAAAQGLMGKMVGVAPGGGMYSQYRVVPVDLCLLLSDDTTAKEGASCFVNPLTALGMVETMRTEGHTALVHTAAASNLGQMLVKICQQDGVELVNIVRRQEHVDMLKELGATYVCNSSDDNFADQLTDALAATGATLAFDATGGGQLAGQILAGMERAAGRTAGGYSRYGSTVHKQCYIYGGLDRSPTTFNRAFGMAWGIGGWLLTPFLQKAGQETANRLRQRVADEIKTTFASHYTSQVSMADALQIDAIMEYGRQATGQKFLIEPQI